MNLYSNVSERMDYIQKLFLGVELHIQNKSALNEIIAVLETEPPEFRSVAYESASFEIARPIKHHPFYQWLHCLHI